MFGQRQRLPGGRAPFAMPRPFTGGCRRLAVALAGRLRRSGGFAVGLRFRLGRSGFRRRARRGAFLAPGLRAPGAMPRPLTSGSGLSRAQLPDRFAGSRRSLRALLAAPRRLLGAGSLGACGDAEALDLGSALAGACAALRRALAAGAALAGAAGVFLAPGRLAPAAMPSPLAGARSGALGGRSALLALSAPAQRRRPSWRRDASHRPRCRVP